MFKNGRVVKVFFTNELRLEKCPSQLCRWEKTSRRQIFSTHILTRKFRNKISAKKIRNFFDPGVSVSTDGSTNWNKGESEPRDNKAQEFARLLELRSFTEADEA